MRRAMLRVVYEIDMEKFKEELNELLTYTQFAKKYNLVVDDVSRIFKHGYVPYYVAKKIPHLVTKTKVIIVRNGEKFIKEFDGLINPKQTQGR